MGWPRYPTKEMPPVPAKTGRRRARAIGMITAGVLLTAAVGVAIFSPVLLGLPQRPARTGPTPSTVVPGGSSTVGVLTSAVPPSSTAPRPSQTDVSQAGTGELEEEVLGLTNAERKRHGCQALRVDNGLRTAARQHSADMARYRYHSHTGHDGREPATRMSDAGYDVRGGWAENIAVGFTTAQAVMDGWMGSPGHRANILTCALKSVGIGVARADNGWLYWTQDFGRR